MNLATPAPKVESATAEPAARETESTRVEAPSAVEEAIAEPAKAVEPAETVDNPHKFAPISALSSLQETKSKNVGVEALRAQGIDFECRVGVVKGGAPKKSWFKLMFPLFFDQRDFVTFSEIARYAVVQNGCCFIFLESTDVSPLYAFSFGEVKAEVEDRDNPDKYSCTVNPSSNTNKTGEGLETTLLRYKKNGKIAYQFTFDVTKDPSVVKRFLDIVERSGSAAIAEAALTTTRTKMTKSTTKEASK